MALDPWMYAAVFGLALVHLLVVAFVSRGRVSSGPGGEASGDPVECPDCGAENGPYRFCRRCVSELPGGASRDGSASAPSGRGIV